MEKESVCIVFRLRTGNTNTHFITETLNWIATHVRIKKAGSLSLSLCENRWLENTQKMHMPKMTLILPII